MIFPQFSPSVRLYILSLISYIMLLQVYSIQYGLLASATLSSAMQSSHVCLAIVFHTHIHSKPLCSVFVRLSLVLLICRMISTLVRIDPVCSQVSSSSCYTFIFFQCRLFFSQLLSSDPLLRGQLSSAFLVLAVTFACYSALLYPCLHAVRHKKECLLLLKSHALVRNTRAPGL